MRNWIIIALALGALFGLIWIQYDLLKVGVLLEKNRLDRKIDQAILATAENIDSSTIVRGQILSLHRHDVSQLRLLEQMLPEHLKDDVRELIQSELRKQKINLPFEFAIIEANTYKTIIQSAGFVSDWTNPNTFRHSIGNRIVSECYCRPALLVQVEHSYSYLLQRLARVIIPSVLFTLILIACIVWLYHLLKQHRKLDQVKNDFINNLTHELKTPVFSISLLLKLIRQTLKTGREEKTDEYLRLIEKENQHLKGHIDMVLELASLESGKFQLEKKMQPIEPLLKTTVEAFLPKVEQKNGRIQLETHATETALPIDETHFSNAIKNLIENAIKYNEQVPDIIIETNSKEDAYHIAVRDNGIGIPADDQKKVFDKFYRVPTGNLHQVKGFGLGLNYVRQVVEAHGGHIQLKSKEKEGSTFTITLPKEATNL